jgi:hypothetical protein
MAVQREREMVAIFPALQCAGTGKRHMAMASDPRIGKMGYM